MLPSMDSSFFILWWAASVTLNQHEIQTSSFHTVVQEVKGQSLSQFKPSDSGQLHQSGSIQGVVLSGDKNLPIWMIRGGDYSNITCMKLINSFM